MYGFDYYGRTLSVTLYPDVRAYNVTMAATAGMTAGRQVQINGAKAMLLDGRRRPEAMQQLHADGDVYCIQEHILVCLSIS